LYRDMIGSPRYGVVGQYLPVNAAIMLVFPLLQFVALVMTAPPRSRPLSSGVAGAARRAWPSRWTAWKDLHYLYMIPLWPLFSVLMSLMAAPARCWSCGAPSRWGQARPAPGVVSRTDTAGRGRTRRTAGCGCALHPCVQMRTSSSWAHPTHTQPEQVCPSMDTDSSPMGVDRSPRRAVLAAVLGFPVVAVLVTLGGGLGILPGWVQLDEPPARADEFAQPTPRLDPRGGSIVQPPARPGSPDSALLFSASPPVGNAAPGSGAGSSPATSDESGSVAFVAGSLGAQPASAEGATGPGDPAPDGAGTGIGFGPANSALATDSDDADLDGPGGGSGGGTSENARPAHSGPDDDTDGTNTDGIGDAADDDAAVDDTAGDDGSGDDGGSDGDGGGGGGGDD
jgi:hypothetical protein